MLSLVNPRSTRSIPSLPRRYQVLLFVLVLYFTLVHLAPAAQHVYQPLGLAGIPSQVRKYRKSEAVGKNSDLKTNLVIASVAADDTSWAEALAEQIPKLTIYRYISDDAAAQYHPPKPRGREALMYFTYLYDKYDDLADINIFVHAEEQPWHLDSALWKSLPFALTRLDLQQVLEKRYFNLYTSLKGGRPEGYNTSKTISETDVAEEPFMAEAMVANFGDSISVPEVLLGPCCSQFAVTRDAILGRPREQYEHIMKWLMETNWPDQLTGRIWEHLWPWLFLREQAVDQKTEWRALCRMYGICFQDAEDLQKYDDVWQEMAQLRETIHFGSELITPWSVRSRRQRLAVLSQNAEQHLLEAMKRGENAAFRYEVALDMTAP